MLKLDHSVDVQVWVCCNDRIGSSKPSCTAESGQAILKALREKLAGSEFSVWVNKSLCQGFCHKDGVAVVVESLKLRWQAVSLNDCDEMVTAIRRESQKILR